MIRIIGLIPARGGSVRIPRKNLQQVGGRTLVARAIAAARNAGLREILVSTDDAEIAEEATAHHADVIVRPAELAAAATPMGPVLRHAITSAGIRGQDLIVLLEPPATFRRASDLELAIETLLSRRDAMAVRTVTRVAGPEYHLHTIDRNGMLRPLIPAVYEAGVYLGRADPPAVWRDNGLANVIRVGEFASNGDNVWGERVSAVETVEPNPILARWRGLDIDEPGDLLNAQQLAAMLDAAV